MAERRMFAKTIIDSDAFLDMPMSAQLLYFHLSMRADDEGFLNNPKKIQRMIGASDDDLRLLKLKKFIITFDSGVIVIKHWRINNYLQKDRCKQTIFQREKSMLGIKDNKAYTLNFEDPMTKNLQSASEAYPKRIQSVSSSDTECIQDVYSSDTECIQDQNGQNFESRMNTDENGMYTECIQNGYNPYTQVSIVKDSIGKDSIGEVSIVKVKQSCETKLDEKEIYKTIIDKWNTLQDVGIEKIKYIGAKREENLKAMLNEYGLSSFDDAIECIRNSDFLQGNKEGYTWRITFDWLIDASHYPAVIEGYYKDYEPFPTVKGSTKAKNFVQIQSCEENWPELEKQLIDN